jgi:hypothetical protein
MVDRNNGHNGSRASPHFSIAVLATFVSSLVFPLTQNNRSDGKRDGTARDGGRESKGSSGFSDILSGAKTLFPKDWGSSGPGSSSKDKMKFGGTKNKDDREKEKEREPSQFAFPDFNVSNQNVSYYEEFLTSYLNVTKAHFFLYDTTKNSVVFDHSLIMLI